MPNINYTVFYDKLDSNIIANCVPPWRLVKTYGKGTLKPHFRKPTKKQQQATIDQRNKKDNFYHYLEQSILEYGFYNPILVTQGYCQPKKRPFLPRNMKKEENILCTDRWGGSRLWVAQKHQLEIPCIISCFHGSWIGGEQLNTEEQIISKFHTNASVHISELGVMMNSLEDVKDGTVDEGN